MEEWDILRKYWTKARLKLSKTNSKAYRSMSYTKGLRWLHPSSFADCIIILSLGLVSLQVCSSPWQMSQSSGVPDAVQASFYTMASQGLHIETPLPNSWLQWLSLITEKDSTTQLFTHTSFTILKPEPVGQCCQVQLPAWDGVRPSPWIRCA